MAGTAGQVGGTADRGAVVEGTMEATTAATTEGTTAEAITEVFMGVITGGIPGGITVVIMGITHFLGELLYGAGPLILAGLIPTMRNQPT